MKIPNLIIAFISITTLALLVSCKSPAEKVEKAEEEVTEANQNLEKANEEYLNDVEAYRLQTADKIADNEKNIIEFNARIEAKKKDANADYKKKVAELDKKNNDMKKKMADYKASGKENWENFKTEFNHDMDALGQAFKDLSVNNVK